MSKSYTEKLQHPNWQKMRLKVLSRDKWRCKTCGDENTTLHVHHKYYLENKDPWDYPMSAFITVCKHCHQEIEDYKSTWKGKVEDEYLEEFVILKSNNWDTGDVRIMFTAATALTEARMVIYKSDKKIIGFNMDIQTQRNILNFFKKALK